jgi:hypothetical protein
MSFAPGLEPTSSRQFLTFAPFLVQRKVTFDPDSTEPGIGAVIWGVVAATAWEIVRVTGIVSEEFCASGAAILIVPRKEPAAKPEEFTTTVRSDGVDPLCGDSESHGPPAAVIFQERPPPLESVSLTVFGAGLEAP